MSIIETLLDDAGVDSGDVVDEETRNRGDRTVGRDHNIDINDISPPGPQNPVLDETDADTVIEPIVELGDEPSEEQFDALEDLNLADPFTLAVEAPDLAGEESTGYGVTAYYDEFDEAPNDRLTGPTTPLSFDEDGIASVTIGSAGTDADVLTWIAPGSLSSDATLVNQIEVPEGTERFAVETDPNAGTNGDSAGGMSITGDSGDDDDAGEFTEREEI